MLLGGITAASALLAFLICMAVGTPDWNWLWLLPAGFAGSFLGLVLLAFLFLWLACQVVDLKKTQTEDSPFYRRMATLYIDAILTIARVRVHTRGLEQTPKSGRFLLVCNHLHEADPPILLSYFRKSQLAFISKRENDSMFIVGKLMHKLLCQPINREDNREALKTITRCIQLLKEDKVSIAVFPEGYIHNDRLFYPFRSGVFKIAKRTQVPIVVCTLTNTNHTVRNFLRLKPTDVDLHLLRVIQPGEYADMSTVQLSSWIHDMMAEDLGPDRVASVEENT